MIQNKLLVYIIILLLGSSCIKPFDPQIDISKDVKYVVDGMVSSEEGWQEVSVSTTSSIDLAVFIPVNGCGVTIYDDEENEFPLEQFEDGKYRVWMGASDIEVGRSYKVKVLTPDGIHIESDFDKMSSGPEVGDVYYQIEDIPANSPEAVRRGIRFYTDFQGDEEDASYYRWRLTETYEYHSEYPLQFYYDENGVNEVFPIDSSKMYCWRTAQIDEVYTLSTLNLTSNSLQAFPLNFVSNSTPRLKIMYSLFIEQYAISEDAYYYWDKLRMNLEQEGGLYTSQPLNIKGNLKNLSDPTKKVLGFFQASTVSSRRIFVEPVEGLELIPSSFCNIDNLKFGVAGILPSDYPAYLFVIDGMWVNSTMSKECVDCTLLGGVTLKPSYWPN